MLGVVSELVEPCPSFQAVSFYPYSWHVIKGSISCIVFQRPYPSLLANFAAKEKIAAGNVL